MNTDSVNRLFDMAFKGLTSEIRKKQEELKSLEKQMSALLEQCPHSNIEPREYYSPGSYFDKAYTDHWDECILCGERFNHNTKIHNHYG